MLNFPLSAAAPTDCIWTLFTELPCLCSLIYLQSVLFLFYWFRRKHLEACSVSRSWRGTNEDAEHGIMLFWEDSKPPYAVHYLADDVPLLAEYLSNRQVETFP